MTSGKRFLSIFLSVILCATSFFGMMSTSALAASSGNCGATGSSVKYSYNSGTKTLTIEGTGSIKDYQNAETIFGTGHAPWSDYREECEYVVVGEGVTRIGNYAFSSMTALKSITLPSTLEEIGERAFYDCTALTDCKLPLNLKTIEGYAFQNCSSLEDVDFPEGLTKIMEFAYNGSGIKSVDFPDSLTSLGMREGTFGIEYEIGSVFYNCKNLESVSFGTGLTETGLNNFSGCSNLKYVDFGSSITTISASSFLGTFITTLVLPENVTTVSTLAFSDIGTLTDVYVYNSECAFNGALDSDPFYGSQQSVVFHGHSQSTTQTYAEWKGYEFVSIDNCAHSNMYENITLEPTCTENGSKDIICSDCGITVRTESIPALGHNFVTDSTEDKTAEDGHIYEYQTCSRCNESNTVITHQEWVDGYYTVNYVRQPTCTASGLGTNVCNICGRTSLVPVIIPATGHKIDNYTQQTPPTCTEDGSETGECVNCGEVVTVTLPATGHKVESYTEQVLPTCTEDGYNKGVCSNCGITITETVPALGHTLELESEGVTEDGGHTYSKYKCSVCGYEYTEYTHNEWVEGYYTEEVISEASCTNMGITERVCSVCGETDEVNTMPTGHQRDEGVVTKEPTCTESGTTTYTCLKCGNELNVPIPALGHDYSVESVLQEPTCTKTGTGQTKCSRCDAATTYEIPALGHNIDGAADYTVIVEPNCTQTGTAAGTCANCGEYVEVELPSGGHVFDTENSVVTKEPTCEEDGVALETCTLCGAQQEVAIPATGHNYRYSHHYEGTAGTYLAYYCTNCGAEHDELKTLVEAGFWVYFNEKRGDALNGYLYDVNFDGYINARDYMIIEEYITIN